MIPWPTDLPLEPMPASFGGISADGQAAARYLVQSAHRSNDLWHLEKRSVKLTDGRGVEVPWPGQARIFTFVSRNSTVQPARK